MTKITRFGISMDTHLLDRFDHFINKRGYKNRSEAIRDLVREQLVQEEWRQENIETVGTITLIYDHHQNELQEKLTEYQHAAHENVISTMHVHLDHHNCLEVLVIKGKAKDIKTFSDQMITTKGVKHGKLVMTSKGEGL